MQRKTLINFEDIRTHHDTEPATIFSQDEVDLMKMISAYEAFLIECSELLQYGKIIHYPNELDVNQNGIETTTHLVFPVNELKEEASLLKSQLQLHASHEYKVYKLNIHKSA